MLDLISPGFIPELDFDIKKVQEMTYKEAMEYIEQAGQAGIVLGLDSIRELCGRLGDPQKQLRFVHVAGTNGKGSVSAYLASVLRCGGYRVGRYISPTIFEYRERIQVNDGLITKTAVCRLMERIKEVCDGMTAQGLSRPTPFEIETAMGFLYFQEKKCDIVVLETGMGGLTDATNIVENTLAAVLTSVSMDHMKFLGDTLPAIAAQKAGILKKGCSAVVLRQSEEVMEVIRGKAAELCCPLSEADPEKAANVRYGLEKQSFDYCGMKKLEISLAGQYQIGNAVLALEVLRVLAGRGFPVEEEKLRRGMAEARWPGRFTVIGRKPWFVVDGAHNEDGAENLARSVEYYFKGKRILYIMGVFADKEYEKIIARTHRLADQIITVASPGSPRALPAYELAREVAKVHPKVTAADSLEEAVEMSLLLAGKDDVVIAFGSLSFLGRLMEIVAKGQGREVRLPYRRR